MQILPADGKYFVRMDALFVALAISTANEYKSSLLTLWFIFKWQPLDEILMFQKKFVLCTK